NEKTKTIKKKVNLEMIIKSASCYIGQDIEVQIKWERGTKNILTKKKIADRLTTDVVFNEKFKMNANFNYN
ncbi:MAG: hypothetical protein ACK56F_02060, partial [bacterium]